MKDNDERELSISNSYSRIVSDSMNSSDKSFSAIFDLTLEFIEKPHLHQVTICGIMLLK